MTTRTEIAAHALKERNPAETYAWLAGDAETVLRETDRHDAEQGIQRVKIQDVDKIADMILIHAIYGGREGFVVTAEDRDAHEYTDCQNAARAILETLTEATR